MCKMEEGGEENMIFPAVMQRFAIQGLEWKKYYRTINPVSPKSDQVQFSPTCSGYTN